MGVWAFFCYSLLYLCQLYQQSPEGVSTICVFSFSPPIFIIKVSSGGLILLAVILKRAGFPFFYEKKREFWTMIKEEKCSVSFIEECNKKCNIIVYKW